MTPEDPDSARSQLEAERAGLEHWRRVARQREAALTDLKARPVVRVVLALERRTVGVRDGLRRGARGVRTRAERAALAVEAWHRRADLPRRRRALEDLTRRASGPVQDRRPLLVIAVNDSTTASRSDPGRWMGPDTGRTVTIVGVRADRGSDSAETIATVNAAVEDHDLPLVALTVGTAEPVGVAALPRLGEHVAGPVGAVGPVSIHPERQGWSATGHDLTVRAAGIEITLAPDGAPVPVARGAGGSLDPVAELVPAAGLGPTAVVFARRAWMDAGGLRPVGSLVHSVLDLCLRLETLVAVAGDVFVLDHREVRSRISGDDPFDDRSDAWRRIVADQGPALVRRARPDAATSFSVTVASPNAKVARHWGDWHLAEGLAHALTRRGHEAVVQPLDAADTSASRSRDVHLVLRGLARVVRTPGQRHVLWVISHPEDLDDEELTAADLILVASERFARELRTRTSTPVEVMLQATDPHRFRPLRPEPVHQHAVTVVGRSRDVLRPMVADALEAGVTPAVYGTGWDGLIDDGLIVDREVPNEKLPVIYSSAGVVLNDHWDTMRHWGFVSNRIFDVAACATPIISDPLPELNDLFPGLVATWNTPDELAGAVADIAGDPHGARSRSERLRELVLARHTFDHRADELLGHLERLDDGSISG